MVPFPFRPFLLPLGLSALLACLPRGARAEASPAVRDQLRLTLAVTQPLEDDTSFIGAAGWFSNPNKEIHTAYFSPFCLVRKPDPSREYWLGLYCYYNDKSDADDTLELRPRAGVKLFWPNDWRWNVYNFTRLEYRLVHDFGDGGDETIPRLRNRAGAEIPLRPARAWEPGTGYGIADVEPYWRLDDMEFEFARARVGMGRVLNPAWRVELLYHRQFARAEDGDFERNDNIWRVNLKWNLGARGHAAEE